MKNTRTALLAIALVLLVIVSVFASAFQVSAAPAAHGITPIYDSGWVQTTSGYQTFDWQTDFALDEATLWTLLVADNSDGLDTTGSPGYFGLSDPTRYYGHLVTDNYCGRFKVLWMANGIGYSSVAGKWYQRGVDYARLIIFAGENIGGTSGIPCRP